MCLYLFSLSYTWDRVLLKKMVQYVGFLILFYVPLLVSSLHTVCSMCFIISGSDVIINLSLIVLCTDEYIYNIGLITMSIRPFGLSPLMLEINVHCVFQLCTHPSYLQLLIPTLFRQSSHVLGSTSGMTLRQLPTSLSQSVLLSVFHLARRRKSQQSIRNSSR